MGFFKKLQEKLSFVTETEFDNLDSREQVRLRQKRKLVKRGLIIGALALMVFLYLIIIKTMELTSEAEEEYARKADRQIVELKVDNFALWQSSAEVKINKIEEQVNLGLSTLTKKMDDTNKKVDTNYQETAKSLVSMAAALNKMSDNLNKGLDDIKKESNQKIDSLEAKTIKEMDTRITDLSDKINKTITDSLEPIKKENEALAKALEEVKNRPIEIPEEFANIPTKQGEANRTAPLSSMIAKKEPPKIKINHIVRAADNIPVKEAEPPKENPSFELIMGVAQATLINGVDARIRGFGTQADSPVMLSLDTKMSVANGEYTNIEDCLLLGDAQGDLTSEKAIIRLTKISCVFKNSGGDRFKAEAAIKGWVTDESGGLGLGGVLVTKEGKIIKSMIPLAAVQTALQILTNQSVGSVNILGGVGGATDITSAARMGAGNAANTSLSKIATLYEKYLNQMNPVINITPGRKVGVLFQGGEKMVLQPFNNTNIAEIGGEIGGYNISLGDNKYNYQEANDEMFE